MHNLYPVITLNDFYTEPVKQTIACFNQFSSTFTLNPFRLITYKNSILVSRCRISSFPEPLSEENCFLSILLINKSIKMDEVQDFIIELASSPRVTNSSRVIYDHLVRAERKSQYRSGEDWAFRQAIFALRIFISMAEERGVVISTLADFDPGLIDDALGIDKSKWRYFSVMMLKPAIKYTPKNLLESGFGFN